MKYIQKRYKKSIYKGYLYINVYCMDYLTKKDYIKILSWNELYKRYNGSNYIRLLTSPDNDKLDKIEFKFEPKDEQMKLLYNIATTKISILKTLHYMKKLPVNKIPDDIHRNLMYYLANETKMRVLNHELFRCNYVDDINEALKKLQ
mgnify:FL=1